MDKLVKETIVFRCPPRLRQEATELASDMETSVSHIIRESLRHHVPVLREKFGRKGVAGGPDNPNN
jgi:hypothetical protein